MYVYFSCSAALSLFKLSDVVLIAYDTIAVRSIADDSNLYIIVINTSVNPELLLIKYCLLTAYVS